ncbi:uncharacterized protein LOC105438370 [Strongylocentrotus purpuratus]|uniref:Uncharacterized protein n=1 Tax=Strongylocentrotus purpuratus TaxID=7668 RepID=A0A7M7NNI4_STRPU|nr:uncharacterized protein LOC105438370 [Strongylocentrotus purpuratus]
MLKALLRELFRKAEYTELIPRLDEYEANRNKYLEKVSMLAGSQESRWLHLDTTYDGNQVHWDFLTDCPQELTLQDNEAVISCGIRFSPSTAKLSKPIKVTLDHDAHFSNPRRAEIVFYTRKKDSKSFERIPASTSSYPRCDVRVKDLDLYVDNFADWWIVAVFTRYFVGKRVNCTPYVLPPVRKEFSHCVFLCIYDDLPDVNDKIDKEMKKYTELHPTQQMFIERKHGDINIKLFEGLKENEKEIGEQRLGERDIFLVDRKQFSFEVKPLEPGERQKFLKFTLNQKESLSDPTSMKFPLPYDDSIPSTIAKSLKTEETTEPAKDDSPSARYRHVISPL